MGADLVMEFIVLPENGYDTREMKDAAYAAIQETTTSDYAQLADQRGGYDQDDEESDDDYLTRLQTLARGLVDSLIEILDNGGRDVCNYLTIAGFEIWASGGMSWGDEPTAAASTFGDVHLLPDNVTRALGIPYDVSTPYTAFMYHVNRTDLPLPEHLRDDLKKWYDQINLAKEL